jgi:pyruvate carboxylase subunit B
MAQPHEAEYSVTVDEREISVRVVEDGDALTVTVGDAEPRRIQMVTRGDRWTVRWGDQLMAAVVTGRAGTYAVSVDGLMFDCVVRDRRAALLSAATAARGRSRAESELRAPMPGLVVSVNVRVGDVVQRGQGLIVLQAMKMENDLVARGGGTVKTVTVQPGQTVEQGQLLVTLE